MQHNVLRRPLRNTAVVLVFFLAMLSISMTHPEATVLGSFWLIILTILRSLQWLLGMTLAVTFCLAFLFAVFFGAAALASPTASASMYAGFRQTLADWLKGMRCSSTSCASNRRRCCGH
jgi:hypothetical protein